MTRNSTTYPALVKRLEASIAEGPDGCWLWQGRMNEKGYGVLSIAGRSTRAHRFSYELHVGEIPSGLVLDHLCRVRHCVNPDHLEPVTVAVNTARGESAPPNRDVTHCPQGHEYTDANTYTSPRSGARHCRACRSGRRLTQRHLDLVRAAAQRLDEVGDPLDAQLARDLLAVFSLEVSA